MGSVVKTAIKPNYFNEFANIKAVEVPVEKEDLDQLALARLSDVPEWHIFEKIKNELISQLDDAVKQQMASGANFDVIGQSTVIKELTKDVITRLFNRVSDAKESRDARVARGETKI